MNDIDLEILKFPIGKFTPPLTYSQEFIKNCSDAIRHFPDKLRSETQSLNDTQLDTPYRPDGWTIRQVVHHCADSHINGFTRMKLALTEDKPIVKPYNQDAFAALSDSKMAIEASLSIIEGVHTRWYNVLCHLKDDDFERSYIHPEYGKEVQLKEFIASYAWHCGTHLGHITSLKKRMGWK